MWTADLPIQNASREEAVHISMPHDRPERRYVYHVTPAPDQVVNPPLNRSNSNYLLAQNVGWLGRLYYTMRGSLLKTLASADMGSPARFFVIWSTIRCVS
jgi:hypothetical protein